MGLFDSESGDTSVIGYSADATASLAQQPSVFDSIGNMVTKGVPLTMLSIGNSFLNTAVEVGNLFGVDITPVKEADQLRSWGFDDAADYYEKHEQGIEAVGLAAGSLIPGGMAIKGIRAMQGGMITGLASRATNLFLTPTKSVIRDALTSIESEGSLFNGLNSSTTKAIALGFRDQAVQALAYETAMQATMHASPLLDDQSWQNVATDSVMGIIMGGGIGGVMEGFSTYGKFRKALLGADVGTKQFELATNIGLSAKSIWDGTSIGGDKAASLLGALYDIPNPTTILGRLKASSTINRAELEFRQTLQDAYGVGDDKKDVVDAFANALLRAKNEGGLTKDQLFETLGRLSKIGRINDDTEIPTSDFFHVNRFYKNTLDRQPTMDDLFTVAPNQEADFSKRYMKQPYATEIKVATFHDTYLHPETGEQLPGFQSTREAFRAGVDMFINRDGSLVVNPSAPNIKEVPLAGLDRKLTNQESKLFKDTGQLPKGAAPLTGAPLVMNVDTGAIKSAAVAVPGDLGNVIVEADKVAFGTGRNRTISPQGPDTPLTVDTTTMDASARYIWADNFRNVRNFGTIEDSDIPLLQALYTQGVKFKGGWNNWVKYLEKNGVELASGEDIPGSQQSMLYKIMKEKDQFITDVTNTHPELSSEAIARMANVKEDYIGNIFSAQTPADAIVPVDSLARVNHVQLGYNVGNAISDGNGQFLRGVVDTQYRVQLIKQTAYNYLAHAMGQDYEKFLAGRYTSKDATITGTGPTMVTFSNAEYGTLGQRAEAIGRNVNNLIIEWNKKDLSALMPVATGIRNDLKASAELGMFTAIRRSTSENYAFLPSDLVEKYMPNAVNKDGVAVLTNSLVKNKAGQIVDWNSNYMPSGFVPGLAKADITEQMEAAGVRGLRSFYELDPKVSDFERVHMQLNDARNQMRNNFYSAAGLSKTMPVGNLYAPPIDTSKYPFIALVRPLPGKAFGDDSVSVMTAETAQDLQQKIAAIDPDNFAVYTKDDIKRFRQVEGDYQSQRNFNTGLANSEMRRKGILNDIFPDTRAESLLKDVQDFHSRQNVRMIRDNVELGNAQLIAEIRDMGEKFSATATSNVNWYSSLLKKQADNPYDSYVRTMLNIKSEPYTLWSDANEKLEAFASTAFRTMRNAFMAADRGVISYEEASQMAERMGLGNPYQKATDALAAYTDIANKLPPTRILSRFVSTINAVQSATAIRLDTFQSLINIISAPIMTLTEAASVRRLAQVELPDGSGRQMPGAFRLLFDAAKDWWDPAVRGEYFPKLMSMGILRENVNDYFKMLDATTLPYGKAIHESVVLQKIEDMTNLAAKWTGSQLSENYVRFVAAMVARRAFEAQGIAGQDLLDNIGTFVNRTHGNYVASQRPIAFQGPIGQAASLFQTYQLNLLQQMTRYIENGEAKTLALFSGLQGTMFGIQGLPGFQMLNQHLIGNAASNPYHKDIYGSIASYADPKLGDWLMYGIASNLLNTGLYSRGDINPRSLSVIPLNPLEFPAISGAVNFFGQLYDTAQKLMKGGAVWQTIANGLEHNGMSRPLAGIAQLAQGYTTTSGGKLISTLRPEYSDGTSGWAEMASVANFGRLLGAKPLDEAVALDVAYRHTMYQANDSAKIEVLGSAARTYLRNNQSMPPDVVTAFAAKYAESGGVMQNFGKELMSWTKSANVGVTNDIFNHLERPINQQMMLQMNGTPLPDYRTTPGQRTLPNVSASSP